MHHKQGKFSPNSNVDVMKKSREDEHLVLTRCLADSPNTEGVHMQTLATINNEATTPRASIKVVRCGLLWGCLSFLMSENTEVHRSFQGLLR